MKMPLISLIACGSPDGRELFSRERISSEAYPTASSPSTDLHIPASANLVHRCLLIYLPARIPPHRYQQAGVNTAILAASKGQN